MFELGQLLYLLSLYLKLKFYDLFAFTSNSPEAQDR